MFNDYNQVDGTGLSNHCLNKRIFILSTKDNSSCGKSNVFYSFIPQNIQNEYFIYSYFPTLCFCCTSFPNGPLVKEDISLGSSRNTNLYFALGEWISKSLQAFYEDPEESMQQEQFGICLCL